MKRTDHTDHGFTLVELLMTVVMTAVIIGAIAAALTTALRNDEATRDRVSDTVDTQLLSTYLPGDVQNAGPNAGDITKDPGETAGCTGLSGTNVLAVKWTDAEAGAPYGVTYRTLAVGTEQRLLRFTCGGATPGASVIARGLAPVAGANADLTGNPRIVFTLTSAKGYASKLSVMRRTYAGGAVAPPPLPCFVDAATLNPPQGRNAYGTLLPSVSLNVRASGNCGTLKATYLPNGTTPHVQTIGTGPGTTTTVLTGTAWTSGDRPVTISSSGAFVADVPFSVVDAPPCAVTNVVASPSSGVRTTNPSPNTLASAVTVTADFSDTCLLPHSLVVSTDGTAAKTFPFSTAGLTRSVTIPAAVKWSDGSHVLAVQQGATSAAASAFIVTPKDCVVAAPALNPVSVNAGADGTLNKAVDITVTTTGVCDALSLKFAPSTTVVLKALVPASTFSTWTYTILASDHNWTTGSKTIEVVNPAGTSLAPARTAFLEVR